MAPDTPVERFRPSSGAPLGWVSIAVLAVVLVVALVSEPNLLGVRIALGIALAAALVWAVLLRPRATAYADTLVLHNMVSDTQLPLAGIEAVTVRQTLNVWVGERRYVCAGIGRSPRQLLRQRSRTTGALEFQRADLSGTGAGGPVLGDVDYAGFVESRIEELARAARRDGRASTPVRRQWAVPELSALLTLAAAFAVSLAF
jgi:hypothetical protein